MPPWAAAHNINQWELPSFLEASVLMQRLSYPTETVLSNKITTNRIVLSFKDPSKPLGRRPKEAEGRKDVPGANRADELDRWGIRRFLGLFVHLGRKGNDFRSFRAELETVKSAAF